MIMVVASPLAPLLNRTPLFRRGNLNAKFFLPSPENAFGFYFRERVGGEVDLLHHNLRPRLNQRLPILAISSGDMITGDSTFAEYLTNTSGSAALATTG